RGVQLDGLWQQRSDLLRISYTVEHNGEHGSICGHGIILRLAAAVSVDVLGHWANVKRTTTVFVGHQSSFGHILELTGSDAAVDACILKDDKTTIGDKVVGAVCQGTQIKEWLDDVVHSKQVHCTADQHCTIGGN